jgi:diacylglycerol kinase (ATP)
VSIAIIINPISGGVRPAVARARAQLARAVVDIDGEPARVSVSEGVGHARELTAAAIAAGARLVLAWGGDGTINEVVSALAFGAVPLGIVPAGSGNGLARELGIDREPQRAIAHAIGASPTSMDVGDVDGHLFANIAGIGFDAHVASQFATAARRGFLGYVGITARALRSYVPLEYRISSGGTHQNVRAVLVTIANSAQFGNGALIAPGARVDDGELDLVVFEERSRLRTVAALPRLFNGTVARAEGCRINRVRDVTIEADQPLLYHVDGEPVAGGTTLHARVHAGALRIAIR